jgi:ribosomal protein L29
MTTNKKTTLSNKELKEELQRIKAQLAEVRFVNCLNEKFEPEKK